MLHTQPTSSYSVRAWRRKVASLRFRMTSRNSCEIATSSFAQDHVTPSPWSFQSLLGDSEGPDVHVSVGISRHLKVRALHAASSSWRGWLSSITPEFVGVLGSYICFHTVAMLVFLPHRDFASGREAVRRMDDSVCLWLGWGMMGTSHAGGCVTDCRKCHVLRIPDGLEAKLTFCEKDWETWLKLTTFYCHLLGLMPGTREVWSSYCDDTKKLLAKSVWNFPRKVYTVGDASAGPKSWEGFCWTGMWKRVVQAKA